MISPHFILYEYNDGLTFSEVFESEEETLCEAAYTYCFTNYIEVEVKAVYCGGQEVFYEGWQPDMLFEFTDKNGTTIFSRQFPNWEH